MKTIISIKISIIISNLYFLSYLFYKRQINENHSENTNENSIGFRLKKDRLKRTPKYILLMDYYLNPYCNDLNAYYIFKYYQKKKNNNAYYIINCKSQLYKYLTKQNQTQNLIPVDSNDNIIDKLYNYFLILNINNYF